MSEDVAALVQMFEASEESTREARKLSERDRDYYDNKQWTAEETAALEKRKQPVVTYNRIARKIDFLSGLEKQQRKDPKAFPRNPKDEDGRQRGDRCHSLRVRGYRLGRQALGGMG
jgi:hypothetical protein